jgi:hypothetical protein
MLQLFGFGDGDGEFEGPFVISCRGLKIWRHGTARLHMF